jgi:hypothetical protein
MSIVLLSDNSRTYGASNELQVSSTRAGKKIVHILMFLYVYSEILLYKQMLIRYMSIKHIEV